MSEIPSERWDLGIELLERGGRMVTLDSEPPVGIARWPNPPRADERVEICVWTSVEPHRVTAEMASADVEAALAVLNEASAADPRLGELMAGRGTVCKYLYDYGMGSVVVASFDTDGSVSMHDWPPPE